MIKSTQDFRRMAGTSLTKTAQPFRKCVFTFRVSRPTRVEWPHEVLRWEKRKPRAPTWSGCVRASRPALRRGTYPATVRCRSCQKLFCDAHAEDEQWHACMVSNQ